MAVSLPAFCQNNPQFRFDDMKSILTVDGIVAEGHCRELISMYPEMPEVHARLRQLQRESRLYLDDQELAELETYVKRIRGEILFARAWLLCEGQSEYLLVRYFAELKGISLDSAGVSVIDFQNNGSPGSFVALARTFDIPWLLICDNDEAGRGFVESVRNRGVDAPELAAWARKLPGNDVDLESFLSVQGFVDELAAILEAKGVTVDTQKGHEGFESEVAERIKRDKTGSALALIERLRESKADASRVPQFFSTAIDDIIRKAHEHEYKGV
jgi:putative ATP-dependent endonuclease of OLD family